MLRFSSHSKLKEIAKPIPGIVELEISPNCPGRVQWQGTSWPARLFQPNFSKTLTPGEHVKVIAVQELTLLVLPVDVNLTSQGTTTTGFDGLWN